MSSVGGCPKWHHPYACGKVSVQELGWWSMDDGSCAIPRQRRRQATVPGCEEYGDLPRSTRHSDFGSANGGPLNRLTKPNRAMVLPQLQRWHMSAMAIAVIPWDFSVFSIFWADFLQMFLGSYLPPPFLSDFMCVRCFATCGE